MTTHRKSTRRTTAARIALRVNGKPVVNGPGAKLAAEWIGCTQTTGSQVGQGNARAMLTDIGRGDIAQFRIDSNIHLVPPEKIEAIAREISDTLVSALLLEVAAALRSAARLREQAQ